MKTENKPSIKTVRFGDGYEQRSPNGLNHSLRVFTCDFKVEANERDSFEKFLARHEGYKSFFGARRVLTENQSGVSNVVSDRTYHLYRFFVSV